MINSRCFIWQAHTTHNDNKSQSHFNMKCKFTAETLEWCTVHKLQGRKMVIRTTWNSARQADPTLSKFTLEFFHVQFKSAMSSHICLFFTMDTFRVSPSASTHLKYLPPNNCTPMILKMSQKTRHTSNTLKIDGMAWISAFTTTCQNNTKAIRISVYRTHTRQSVECY